MRTGISRVVERIGHSGVWLALAGTFLLVLGLSWDVTIHEADPGLAAHESVFTVDNPAHVVFLTGIGLIVVGMLIFLADRVRSQWRLGSRRRLAAMSALAIAFAAVVVVGGVAAAAAQVDGSTPAGHDHAGHAATFVTAGPGCEPAGTPVTDAQRAAAARLVSEVRQAWSPTLTEAQAEALGYRPPATPSKQPALAHFGNPALARGSADLLDPARPQALVFLKLPDGRTVLGGVLFTAPVGQGPCIGGSLTLWHYHQAGAKREMIHVWLYDNPAGPFAVGTGGSAGLTIARAELE